MKVEALHYCYGESGPCHPFFGVKMVRLNTCHKFGPYPPCTPFKLNSVLRPPFSFSWPNERQCHLFYMKHAGSLKKNSPEDSAIHRAYVEDKRDKYIDAGVVFLAYVLRI